MVPGRYDVTEVVVARRRTRPPTWLRLVGLVVGWALDAALVVALVREGFGTWVAVGAVVLGYLLLQEPASVRELPPLPPEVGWRIGAPPWPPGTERSTDARWSAWRCCPLRRWFADGPDLLG